MIQRNSNPQLETVADLIHSLGDIPPARILINPPPGTATEAHLIAAGESEFKRLCELIDGVLVEKDISCEESEIATSDTVAGLIHRLGDIPPERILLNPPPGLATEEDVIAYEGAGDKRLCELIDGVLVEKDMGFAESVIAAFIITRLSLHVSKHNLGVVSGSDSIHRLLPGRVRLPDVAFVAWNRFPNRKIPTEPVVGIAPNLAVEVISKRNTVKELEIKRQDYFVSGVELVWEINPRKRTVVVYHSPDNGVELTPDDGLSGEGVVPGFKLPVAEIWAKLDQQG